MRFEGGSGGLYTLTPQHNVHFVQMMDHADLTVSNFLLKTICLLNPYSEVNKK